MELESRPRLKGVIYSWAGLDIHAYFQFLQAAGPDSTNAAPRRPEIAERGLNKAKSGRRLRRFLCSDLLLLMDEHGKTLACIAWHGACMNKKSDVKAGVFTVKPVPLDDNGLDSQYRDGIT
jgi:hypothetical protein